MGQQKPLHLHAVNYSGRQDAWTTESNLGAQLYVLLGRVITILADWQDASRLTASGTELKFITSPMGYDDFDLILPVEPSFGAVQNSDA